MPEKGSGGFIDQPFPKYLVPLPHFKVALAVIADRADLGSRGSHDQVSADTTLPHGLSALFKDLLHFHVVQQFAIPLFVRFFDRGHFAEFFDQFGQGIKSAF